MPHMAMEHTDDPKQALLDAVGDLEGFEVFNNDVVIAVYKRPEKTKSGIILPDQNRAEDTYQSKVGLVIKMGPEAFMDPAGVWFSGVQVGLHDWIWFRPSDGFHLQINKTDCRALKDTVVRGKVPHPDFIW